MKKLHLKIIMTVSALAATFGRPQSDSIALANTATPPPAAAAPKPEAEGDKSDKAADELARLKKREKAIKEKIALSGGSLTREQAEASYDNQAKFDKANAERKAKAKK